MSRGEVVGGDWGSWVDGENGFWEELLDEYWGEVSRGGKVV